jgi:hypothetical protein
MTTATKTKTKTCKSVSFFGTKCKLKHGHTTRHTWDTNDYRRKKWDTQGKAKKKATPAKSKKVNNTPATKIETSEVIDVMISFDTTGSMFPCLQEVRSNVAKLVGELFRDIPDLRIGIIAHGDYCDANYRDRYVTKMLNLTRDEKAITNFVKTVGRTGGGDAPECYELVLHEARTLAKWETGRNKVLVLIGDDIPHPASYHMNRKSLDWRKECRALGADGVGVYTVQCLNNHYATSFYKEAAEITGGHHLPLDNFNNIRDLIKAVCYKQQSVEALETFVRAVESGGRMTEGMSKVYSTLLGREISADGAEADGAKHIDPSRFIVFKVTKDMDIRDFVESKRKDFRKGCGFYQFTKSVKVQDHKEIILLENETGDMFGGRESRRILGLPEYGTISVSPTSCAALQDGRYTAFVQSTSVNRKLLKGTKFLFENEHFKR